MDKKRPLRIGITCYPTVGGSGVVATELGIELAKRGHEMHFISYDRPFRLPEQAKNIYFHKVHINSYGLFKYPDYTLPLSVEMAKVSCKYNLDILHVHYAVPHATAAILAQCMLPEDKQPKVVTTLHGTDTTLLGADPGYGPAILHALQQSDVVTAVSEFLKTETARVIGFKGDIRVIYNFSDLPKPTRSKSEVRQELGIKDDEVMIIHASNLRPVKRFDLLLKAVAALKDRKKFKLVVIAGNDFTPFHKDVQSLGLTDNVVVRENVLQIENYLQAADLALYTSDTESFCLSILEGMLFNCPSVSTNVGGIPEVVKNNETGLLVPKADVEALTKALESLIQDSKLRKELGDAAAIDARARFSANILIPQYEDLYYSLIEKKLVTDSALSSSSMCS
ncbi:N-acetyl-alpha-D-glucosaminyl L-malate synthase BshA [bacterium]|nr:N-acetyl-alpha-D-glucosaminyl L-malate synthase BshA [bacterium]QQR57819.1 MAG: N-acetyl-alpha-D-glucosaminyl L-malate synthase BshA [Candidatus Melainabacteria bacterium]